MKSNRVTLLVFLFLFWAGLGRGEKSCGEAKILGGASCSSLRVIFDLETCGGKKEEARIECDIDRASAWVSTEQHTYHIPVREIAPGVWTLVGTVREHPKNWKPEARDSAPILFRLNRPPENLPSNPSVFEVRGQFRFRAEENRKNDFSTERGFSSLRARAGLYFYPQESTGFVLEPQAVQIFGEPTLQPATSSANVLTGTSGANRDPQLLFHQAFGEFRANRIWRLILGRQVLVFGDEVLVGSSDWENPGRSFDGFRSRVEWGTSSWDLFSTKLWDANTQTSKRGDRDFHGTYLTWTHPKQQLSLAPYVFWLRDHRSNLTQIFTSGLHMSLNLGDIEVRTEASGQWGDGSGQQAWAQMKSRRFSDLGLQVGLDGFWSSIDFNALFPSTHKWLGWADVLGRRNLSGLGFQVGGTPFKAVELFVRGLHFLRVDTDFPAYQVDGTTPLTLNNDKGSSLGSEVDFIFKSSLIPAVELVAAASIFFPGECLKPTFNEPWLGRFELSFISNF